MSKIPKNLNLSSTNRFVRPPRIQRFLTSIATATLVVGSVVVGSVSVAGADSWSRGGEVHTTYVMCHRSEHSATWKAIRVEKGEMKESLRRGDLAPGSPVPGNPGYVFSSTCSFVQVGSPVLSLDQSSVDFGDVAVNAGNPTQTFTVTNTGTASSGPLSVGVSSTLYSTHSDTCSGVALAAGNSCTFAASFSPTTDGRASATLTVSASPGGTMTASLTGYGVSLGTLVSDTPSLNLYNSGQNLSETITVTNTSVNTTPSLAFTSDSQAGITFTGGNCPTNLGAGGSCVLNFTVANGFVGSACNDAVYAVQTVGGVAWKSVLTSISCGNGP